MNFINPQIGQSYWKVMRDTSGLPIEVKEWVLVQIDGRDNHCLYFNNAGDSQFAYAHHYNDDWFNSFPEAANAMQESLNSHMVYARRRVEEIEVIQHNLVEAINRNAIASHASRNTVPGTTQVRVACSNGKVSNDN